MDATDVCVAATEVLSERHPESLAAKGSSDQPNKTDSLPHHSPPHSRILWTGLGYNLVSGSNAHTLAGQDSRRCLGKEEWRIQRSLPTALARFPAICVQWAESMPARGTGKGSKILIKKSVPLEKLHPSRPQSPPSERILQGREE